MRKVVNLHWYKLTMMSISTKINITGIVLGTVLILTYVGVLNYQW